LKNIRYFSGVFINRFILSIFNLLIMKKLLLMVAAVAAMTFASCDNTANKTEQTTDSVAAFNVEQFDSALANVTDSAAVVDLLNNANAEVQKLVEAGKNDEAQSLLAQIKEIVNKNTEKLTAIVPSIGTLVDQVVALPEGVKDVVENAGDSLKDAATEKANEVVEGAKAAANEAADKAIDKANEAADKAADKASEAANKAADKAKDAAKDAAKKIGL